MSHHLDSPLARQDQRLDISDVYLFGGTSGTVFVINVNPLSGPDGFHPEALYEFKIDTDGDAVEDITFRAVFGELDADGRQAVEVRRLDGPAARDREAAGVLVARGRTGRSSPVRAVFGSGRVLRPTRSSSRVQWSARS